MMPDKIYLPWEHAESDVLPPGVTSKQVFGKDICYIRKDALLEWANGELMPGNSKEGKGWNLAIQTLIDKLNNF